jgi:DnaJ family protein C protein 2
MLALPLGDGIENKIFSSYTLSDDYFKKIEPAGRPFEKLVEKKLKSQKDTPANFLGGDDDDEDLQIEEETTELWWEIEHKEASEKNMKNITSKDDNYYAMLGIEDLFLNATDSDIRKAYKRVALIYHPDKNKTNKKLEESEGAENEKPKEKKKEKKKEEPKAQKNAEPGRKMCPDDEEEGDNITEKELTEEEKKFEEINNKWLKIKEAYDCLLDVDKRKKYDSTFEFDETIPDDEEVDDERDFFLTYGPTFMRNAIWSKKKPIPKIGDMNTPIEKVKKFYKFWFAFNSWRDYEVKDEYNLEGK